jgi:MPBQ/MSBQ methyltransferase
VVRAGPKVWWKTIRDGVCIERMHRAFDKGLMEYGMVRGTKAPAAAAAGA